MSLNLLWSLKLRGTVTECISIIKNIGHSTWKVQHCRTFSPRPGSPLRTESACGVWWWPWCRWSPGQWWCHFCSCLFARKLDGHVLIAAPAPTHTNKHSITSCVPLQGSRETQRWGTDQSMKMSLLDRCARQMWQCQTLALVIITVPVETNGKHVLRRLIPQMS